MKKNTPDSQPPKSKKESALELFLSAVTIIIVVIMCGRFAYHLYEYVTYERPLFVEEVIEEPINVDIRHLSAKAETHRFNENELLLKEAEKNKQTECIAVLKRVNKKEKKTRSTSVDKSTRRYSPPKKITLEESKKMYLRNHKAVGKKTNSKQKTGNRKEDKEDKEETDL